MYKVFIKDRRIVFTNNQQYVDNMQLGLTLRFYNKDLTPIIVDLLHKSKHINEVVVFVADAELAFKEFQSHFTIIEAAGGVVKNNFQQTLFIFRNGYWDLPKGKIEKNEKIEEAAVREVEEECGVDQLKILNPLQESYHIYNMDNRPILKKTYWFDMTTSFEGKLIPQSEEGIEKVEWFNNDQINEVVMQNTYSSIADFINSNVC